MTDMTEAQAKALNWIIHEITEDAARCAGEYEFKAYEVYGIGSQGTIALYAVTGLKDDVGTLAANFCRKSYHIFIDTHGGLMFVNDKGKKKNIKTLDILQSV